MPSSLAIAAFVLGAVLLLIALLGGQFKIFGAEVSGVAGRPGRILAGAVASVFLVIGLLAERVPPSPDPPSAPHIPEAQRKSRPLSLHDLAGDYSLIYADGVTKLGDMGMSIAAGTETQGRASMNLPMTNFMKERELGYLRGQAEIELIGHDLRIKLDSTLSMWRRVSLSGTDLILSWEAGDGDEQRWILRRLRPSVPVRSGAEGASTSDTALAALYYYKGNDLYDTASKSFTNPELAYSYYSKSIELRGVEANPFDARGRVLLQMKDARRALADFTKAIELSQFEDHEFYNNRGVAHWQLGQRSGACQDWRRAAKLGNADAKRNYDEYC